MIVNFIPETPSFSQRLSVICWEGLKTALHPLIKEIFYRVKIYTKIASMVCKGSLTLAHL